MRFLVLSRSEAERTPPPTNAACISIKCSGDTDAELPDGYRAVLRLEFDDLDFDRIHAPLTADDAVARGMRPFTTAIAEKVWAWYREQEAAGVETIVVHCWAGASRSPGVVLGLLRGLDELGADELGTTLYPCHNRYVRRLMAEAA